MTEHAKIASRAAVASALFGALAGLCWGLSSPAALAQSTDPGIDPGIDPMSPEEEAAEAPAETGPTQRPSAEEELAVLLEALRDPEAPNPEAMEERIVELWSRSGSATADLLLERGRAALGAQELGIAIGHLTALTDHAPDFAEGWNARATAFFMMEEFGLAMADIERVLELNPEHFGALAGLGLILDQTGRPEAALAAFREAQRLNPHRDQINQAVDRLAPEVDGQQL
ncbi:MAG: tetratricopeptide repeat protein [Pseudomonadota bacterium]